jgi:hypothetical protein
MSLMNFRNVILLLILVLIQTQEVLITEVFIYVESTNIC